MLFAMLGQPMPGFWLGIMLILILGVQHKWMPISGRVPILEPLFAGDLGKVGGSLEAIRQASLEELAATPGMTLAAAKRLQEGL